MDSANSDAIELGYSLPDGFGVTRDQSTSRLQTPDLKKSEFLVVKQVTMT